MCWPMCKILCVCLAACWGSPSNHNVLALGYPHARLTDRVAPDWGPCPSGTPWDIAVNGLVVQERA